MRSLGPALTTALLALALTACGADDAPPTRAVDPAPAVTDPCPQQLVEGQAAGEADEVPDLGAPDQGWVCAYALGETTWELDGEPVELDDAGLGKAMAAWEGTTTADPGRMCTMELGPRWVLVVATGGDTTAVVADAFGCREVRVTDDPADEPPGGALANPELMPVLRDLAR